MNTESIHFVDVLTLREGKTFQDALAYFERALPILSRHGFRRLSLIELTDKLRGHQEVNPHLVQVWQTKGRASFQQAAADPDYQALVPTRDATFDMQQLQGWFGSEVTA